MTTEGWRPSDVIDALTLIGSVVIIIIGWTTKKYVDGRMSDLFDLIRQLTGVRDRRSHGARTERRRPAMVVRLKRRPVVRVKRGQAARRGRRAA